MLFCQAVRKMFKSLSAIKSKKTAFRLSFAGGDEEII
jgi:hypothetical protein